MPEIVVSALLTKTSHEPTLTWMHSTTNKMPINWLCLVSDLLPSITDLLIEFNVPDLLKDTVSHTKVLPCRLGNLRDCQAVL